MPIVGVFGVVQALPSTLQFQLIDDSSLEILYILISPQFQIHG